ncbi:hypothetical protein [Roseibium algae]|uniref:Uncharacterized protein n=1 Tax=Roseibium algae TaxID=3123038 RepID=A0ABU8TG69_9HYPH
MTAKRTETSRTTKVRNILSQHPTYTDQDERINIKGETKLILEYINLLAPEREIWHVRAARNRTGTLSLSSDLNFFGKNWSSYSALQTGQTNGLSRLDNQDANDGKTTGHSAAKYIRCVN